MFMASRLGTMVRSLGHQAIRRVVVPGEEVQEVPEVAREESQRDWCVKAFNWPDRPRQWVAVHAYGSDGERQYDFAWFDTWREAYNFADFEARGGSYRVR
jgi:hypothetical protein